MKVDRFQPTSLASQALFPPESQRRTPARLLLDLIAKLYLLNALGMTGQILRDGFTGRTPEYLDAGTAMLLRTLGLAVLLLAIKRLSPTTRILTVTWRLVALLMLVPIVVFEQLQSILEVATLLAVAILLVSLGAIAIRDRRLLGKIANYRNNLARTPQCTSVALADQLC